MDPIQDKQFNYPIDTPFGVIHHIHDAFRCGSTSHILYEQDGKTVKDCIFLDNIYTVIADVEEIDYREFADGDTLLDYLRSPSKFIANNPNIKSVTAKRTLHAIGGKYLVKHIVSGNL